MPYKEGRKWRACVQLKGQRHTASFDRKSDAILWESKTRKMLKRRLPLNVNQKEKLLKIEATDLDGFKQKYQELYKNPYNTICDIFDEIARETSLPFRYKDVLGVAIAYQEKRNLRIKAGLRTEILQRDNHTCQRCGESGNNVKLHVDHIIPKSKGGITESRNLETLCKKCNLGKNNKAFYLKKT